MNDVTIQAIKDAASTLFNDNYKYMVMWSDNGGILWYPMFYVIAFFVVTIIASLAATYRYKISYDLVVWYVIILVPTCLLGARLWSAIIGDLKWEDFFKQTGGMAIQGGVVVGVIDALIFFPLMTKKPKYQVRVVENDLPKIIKPSFLIFVDCIIPLILFGQAIGRWGNYFNGELYGGDLGNDPQSMQWLQNIMPGVPDRMMSQISNSEHGLIEGHYYQPLFLYEGVLNILSFMVIYFWLPNYKNIKLGVIGASYFWIYGIIRFSLEPLRNAQYTFSGTYVINAILTALGVIFTILFQFITPKYRHKQLLYMVYIKYMRYPLIKIGIKFKNKKAMSFQLKDKGLVNYGFEKPYNFIRNEHNPLYYADR